MNEKQSRLLRLSVTALVMLAELAHLAWEHFNGGVLSHHILQRADLPAISNWWGTLLLPALTWFLTGRILRRMALDSGGREATAKWAVRVAAGFVGALLYGLLLALTFTLYYETISFYLFLGMFLAALLIPVYRAEYVLGFILGMTFTFGAVLPTIVASLVAAVSAALHFVVRLIIRFGARNFQNALS